MHKVFFEDDVTRWRCMNCDVVYSSVEWAASDGEIVKVGYWRHCKRLKEVSK